MNLKDITDKLKGTIIPKDVKKEDFELTEQEKNEIVEVDDMAKDQNPISDETEIIEEQPLRIKTMIVKQEDEQKEFKKKKLADAAKIAAGVGVAAVAGLAVILISSRKKKW
jgi:hypothetical protein